MAWFSFGRREMQPYPLVDPVQLFSILPNAPKRGIGEPTDPEFFDRFGYLKGERGIRVAVIEWKKRPVSQHDPYDVDLMVVINATPSPGIASEAFAVWLQDKTLSAKAVVLEMPSTAADQIHLQRLQAEGVAPLYIMTARYGNYVLRLAGRIVAGGYFENEQQFFKQMQTLSANVRAVLEQHAAADRRSQLEGGR